MAQLTGHELKDALTWGLDHPGAADARALAGFLARSLGPATVAILHYGSRAQGRQPRADSAYDFFVIVDNYRAAYESLTASVGTSYSAGLATALAHVLPPNVISVTGKCLGPEADCLIASLRAKCCVISLADFKRACSPRRRDHFVQGRLFQFVVMAWMRGDGTAREIGEAIAEARAATFIWGRPSLPDRFTVDQYVHAVLARSLDGEIRPEVGDHAKTLAEAQQDALRAIYGPLLQSLAARGELVAESPGTADLATTIYRQRVPPTRLDRWRVRWYLQRSKARTTARLLKHVVLYEGWLDYIVRKIERSGDSKIELTRREQRWPLIFLWPRFFRYLRDRPQRRRPRDIE